MLATTFDQTCFLANFSPNFFLYLNLEQCFFNKCFFLKSSNPPPRRGKYYYFEHFLTPKIQSALHLYCKSLTIGVIIKWFQCEKHCNNVVESWKKHARF